MAKSKPVPPDRQPGPAVEIGARGLLVVGAVLVLLAAGAWAALRRPAPPAPGTVAVATPPATTTLGSYRGQPTAITAEGYPVVGPATAPVTLVVFSDFQCPNCRQFALEVLPWLAERWMAAGLVRVVFRDFVVRGPESQQAAEAARCAGEQGRFWDYHETLFQNQLGENGGAFAPERLKSLAAATGLDADALAACLASSRQRGAVEAATAFARQQGFAGSPAYTINGRSVSGAIPVARWEELFQLYASELGIAVPAASPVPGGTG